MKRIRRRRREEGEEGRCPGYGGDMATEDTLEKFSAVCVGRSEAPVRAMGEMLNTNGEWEEEVGGDTSVGVDVSTVGGMPSIQKRRRE